MTKIHPDMKRLDLVLRYLDALKQPTDFELGIDPVVLGRAPNADIILLGDNISRRHCEIRYWDGDYIIKDLHSKNGIRINGEPVEVAILRVHDTVEIGSMRVSVDSRSPIKSGQTEAKEIVKEMQEGKGYRTILRQIVDDVNDNAVDED